MDESRRNNPDQTNGMSRRYFLEMVGIGSIIITAAGGSILTLEYLSPNVLFEPPSKFKAGSIDEYEPGSVTKLQDQKVYIVRAKAGYFYALSDVCTHLGCVTNWNPDDGTIACPCHGSRFDMEGNVVHGPAPRPLPRYELTRTEPGELVVDKSRIVGPDVVLKI